MLRNHEEVERHQNILHIGYEVRPILNELVHANTSHSVDTIGNGKHFTTMFKRKISRNQSPALKRCNTKLSRFCVGRGSRLRASLKQRFKKSHKNRLKKPDMRVCSAS